MLDKQQIQKIRDEMAEKPDPMSLLVEAEIRRIRSAAITSSDEDCEDLITYAKSIVALRFDLAAIEQQSKTVFQLRREAQHDALMWQYSISNGDHPPLLVAAHKRAKAAEARATAAEATVTALQEALEEIAKQHLPDEVEPDEGRDWEIGYEGCVRRARTALATIREDTP